MFICNACGNAIGPRVSPITKIDAVRPVVYNNKIRREDGSVTELVSNGTEIVSESKLCPDCAGVPREVEIKPDYSNDLALATMLHKHASGCHKALSDCKLCQSNIRSFAEMPLEALSLALENRPKEK